LEANLLARLNPGDRQRSGYRRSQETEHAADDVGDLCVAQKLGGLSFRLRAECILRDRRVTLCLATGDPIFPAGEPRAYDSKIEERFARDFRRAARDWEIIREPEPVVAGNALLFPDFVLQHRCDGGRRWILEIVGFWTPEYLDRKLTLYRRAGLRNLILCIDDERQCADGDLPVGARVLRFRRHVAVEDVLRILRGPR